MSTQPRPGTCHLSGIALRYSCPASASAQNFTYAAEATQMAQNVSVCGDAPGHRKHFDSIASAMRRRSQPLNDMSPRGSHRRRNSLSRPSPSLWSPQGVPNKAPAMRTALLVVILAALVRLAVLRRVLRRLGHQTSVHSAHSCLSPH